MDDEALAQVVFRVKGQCSDAGVEIVREYVSRERDSLRAALEVEREAHEKTRHSLGAFAELASTSMKRISDLEGALREFADLADKYPDAIGSSFVQITVARLRQAKALLSRPEGKEGR